MTYDTAEDAVRAVMLAYAEEALAKVRICTSCMRFFVKDGTRREHCSPVCGQKARWAKYAAHRPPRDYKAEYAARYAKHMT